MYISIVGNSSRVEKTKFPSSRGGTKSPVGVGQRIRYRSDRYQQVKPKTCSCELTSLIPPPQTDCEMRS